MSLLALSETMNRERDKASVLEAAALIDAEPRPEEAAADADQGVAPTAAPDETPLPDAARDVVADPIVDPAGPGREAAPVRQPAAPVAGPEPAPIETRRSGESAGETPREQGSPEDGTREAAPKGLPKGSVPIVMTDEARLAALVDERVRGSIVDGGPAEALRDGKQPRPSLQSRREIAAYNRRRLGDLEIRMPPNWPEFMPFPSDADLRALRREGVTVEMIRGFEEMKQRQADEMQVRARQINDWIFGSGDMKLNQPHQMARSRNRTEAIRKRSKPIEGIDQKIAPSDVGDVTDEELYKDLHYGILFASLLSSNPDHLNRLAGAQVAAWGHDRLRTMDGGQVRATPEELVVLTVSMQAAEMLVLEAKARGWETLQVSGDNEFCAAVKRACKQNGMGAIIRRRGMLGFGPFSKPEIIMPPLPQVPRLDGRDPGAEGRERKAEGAPPKDRDAADALLDKPGRPLPANIPVHDPLKPTPGAEPAAPVPE